MKMSSLPMAILEQIGLFLERGEPFALLTVINRSGSGPRETGAMMIVDREGGSFGTIGGGGLEAQAKVWAGKVIAEARAAARHYVMTNTEASELGMICGGQMEILADYIPGGDWQWTAFVRRLGDRCRRGQSVCLIRSIRKEGDHVRTGLGVVDEDGFFPGSLDLVRFDPEEIAPGCLGKETRLLERGDIRYFFQPVEVPGTVFIFGAGHVGQALVPLCHSVGFRTIIVDDRKDYANEERFPMADEIYVPESFEAFLTDGMLTEGDYAVIVTRGHTYDQVVLSRVMRTSARYIGMIASRRKRDILFRALMDDGYEEQELKRIHSPIGLDIGARTPGEIAVSIVAELIAVRAGHGMDDRRAYS